MTTLRPLLEGLRPLAQVADDLHLTLPQRARCAAIVAAVDVWRVMGRHLFGAKGRARHQARLAQLTGNRLKACGTLRAADGPHYLSEAEITRFERDGYLPPFEVLPRAEALALGDDIERRHADGDFARHTMTTPEIVAALQRANAYTLEVAAGFQHLRLPAIFALTKHPAIAGRMASLLGDDVLCWRTHFFHRAPGGAGTFWHQNSVFREFDEVPKLIIPEGRDPGMAQLNVWVALRDATIRNGTLRLVPGSFEDARLEYLYSYAVDETLAFLAELPRREVPAFVKVGLFAPTKFERAYAAFHAASALLGGIYDHLQALSLEVPAGSAIIFSSLNLHATHDNITEDETRLTFVARYIPGEVQLNPAAKEYTMGIPGIPGGMRFPVAHYPCVQVHGQHERGLNRVVSELPTDLSA